MDVHTNCKYRHYIFVCLRDLTNFSDSRRNFFRCSRLEFIFVYLFLFTKKKHFIAASGIVAEFSRNTLLSRFVYMEINFSPGYMSANNKLLSDYCEAFNCWFWRRKSCSVFCILLSLSSITHSIFFHFKSLFLCLQTFPDVRLITTQNDYLGQKRNWWDLVAHASLHPYRSIANMENVSAKISNFFPVDLNFKISLLFFFWRHRYDMRWKQINFKIRTHSATVCRGDHLETPVLVFGFNGMLFLRRSNEKYHF